MRFPTYRDLDALVKRPSLTRRAMNLWPPYLASSLKIMSISPDFRRVRVRLRHNRITANYLGTLYGASLFSLADPWWVMMLANNLPANYQVWDKRAEIEFIAKGRTHAYAEFVLDQQTIDEILTATADGEKHFRWFSTDIRTADGTLIARVNKEVYIRRR